MKMSAGVKSAKIAVVGAGWWSQGWHLPGLHNNPRADLVAIVDPNDHPKSALNPDLKPMDELAKMYETKTFKTFEDLLAELGDELDGVLICTPHSTHHTIGRVFIDESKRRSEKGDSFKPLHILMEKPMSANIDHSIEMLNMVSKMPEGSCFLVNHSANYREQAKIARDTIAAGKIGPLKHISANFAAPLKSIFEDPDNKGWTEPSDDMIGNGFGWGQSAHLLGWIYHVCPTLRPSKVFCLMEHSENSGADVAHAATVECKDVGSDDKKVVMSISGTSLLPGDAHSENPVGKKLYITIYGETGSVFFAGDDRDPESGRLELYDKDGVHVLHDKFHFENLDSEGIGPESLQNFVNRCCGEKDIYNGATVEVGARAVQTIDAMYRSNKDVAFIPVKEF